MRKGIWLSAIQISRPINVLIAMVSILVGAIITGTFQPFFQIVLACFSGGLIMAGANTINDVFDIEIDRINQPNRPLVLGKLSAEQARSIAWWEFGIGVSLSVFINWLALAVSLLVSFLIVFYSYKLKRLPLIGNFTVSLATAMAFIYGGIAVDRVRLTLVPAVLAFLYHFGREIIKDIQDMKGDQHDNARTLPLVYGEPAALIITTIIFLFLLVLLPFPFLFDWYQIWYLIIVLVGVYPVIVFVIYSMWKDRSSWNLRLLSKILKADMVVGLLAIYLG
jgi:geranylgeranylglycerol-phosphate geranylgeranyltransferase